MSDKRFDSSFLESGSGPQLQTETRHQYNQRPREFTCLPVAVIVLSAANSEHHHLSCQRLLVQVTILLLSCFVLEIAGAYLEGVRTGVPPPKLGKGLMHSRENH